MVNISSAPHYKKHYKALILSHPELSALIRQSVKFFEKNPHDTRLDIHPLTKRLSVKWSFSVTEDIRIIYEWTNKTTVRLLAIGTHTSLYSGK